MRYLSNSGQHTSGEKRASRAVDPHSSTVIPMEICIHQHRCRWAWRPAARYVSAACSENSAHSQAARIIDDKGQGTTEDLLGEQRRAGLGQLIRNR